MVAHILAPALDPDPNHVASISPAIVTGLLKQQMGFKGLVVTDAMDMNGLTKLFPEGGSAAAGRAAVEAVKAGNDVLLIPSDLDGSYNGLLQAVRSGEIPESRIDQSVLKILRAKASVGLNKATHGRHRAPSTRLWPNRRAWPLPSRSPIAPSPWCATTIRCCRCKATRTGTNRPQNAYQPAAETTQRHPCSDFHRRQPF